MGRKEDSGERLTSFVKRGFKRLKDCENEQVTEGIMRYLWLRLSTAFCATGNITCFFQCQIFLTDSLQRSSTGLAGRAISWSRGKNSIMGYSSTKFTLLIIVVRCPFKSSLPFGLYANLSPVLTTKTLGDIHMDVQDLSHSGVDGPNLPQCDLLSARCLMPCVE